MRTYIIIISLSSMAYGLTANFNGDCKVDFEDWAMLAASWQENDPNVELTNDSIIDYNDISVFASQWLEYEGNYGPPTANNITIAVNRGSDGYIELSATDPNNDTLTYRVTSLPAYGSLYDPNGTDPNHTDPNSDNPAIIAITSVPYTLVGNDNWVLIHTDPNYGGQVTFNYDANDGDSECGGIASATVTVYCTGSPIAFDSEETCVQYLVYSFELEAIDDNDLVYDVNSKPNGIIKDPFVGSMIIDSNVIPWRLRNYGNQILYTSDTVGNDIFNWYAYDGNENSNVADVNITVTANPMNGLYLNGEPNSFIVIPDNGYFDLEHGWGISFYFNNYWRKPYINPLISKRDDGQGWEVSIMAGKVQFDLYDTNGVVLSFRSGFNVSDGDWWPILIEYLYDPNDSNDQYVSIWVDEDVEYTNSVSGNYANDANIVVSGDCGFDHLRFWDDTDYDNPLWPPYGRTDYGESIFGLGNVSNVRYKMDEGSGGVITDDKGNADDGVFDPNYVIWHPPYGIFKSLVKHYR